MLLKKLGLLLLTSDVGYWMRSGSDARKFFVEGKVFSMLYIENASETCQPKDDDEAYTVVRFNERAYSTIRRFVVVDVKKGFVKAW